MCALLGMGDEAVVRAFSVVSGEIFEKALLGFVRDQVTMMFMFSTHKASYATCMYQQIGIFDQPT